LNEWARVFIDLGVHSFGSLKFVVRELTI